MPLCGGFCMWKQHASSNFHSAFQTRPDTHQERSPVYMHVILFAYWRPQNHMCALYLFKYVSIYNIQFISVSQYMANIHHIHGDSISSCVIHYKRPVGFKRLHIPDLCRKIYNFHVLRIICFFCFSL